MNTFSQLFDLPSIVESPWWFMPLFKLTMLLMLAWLFHFAIAKLNPRWRVMLWRTAVVGLLAVLILDVTQFVSLPMQVAAKAKVSTSAPSTSAIKQSPVVSSTDNRNELDFADFQRLTADAAFPSGMPVDLEPNHQTPIPPTINTTWQPRWSAIVGAIWLVGILISIVLEFVGRRRLSQIISLSMPASSSLSKQAAQIAKEMQVKPCKILISDQIGSPLVCRASQGNTLLVPEAILAESDHQELNAILIHELSHVAAKDLEWNFLIKIIATVLWPHPLLWRLRKVHVAACEYVADAESARRLKDPSFYIQTLAKVALGSLASQQKQLPGLAMARASEIRTRLERVSATFSQLPLPRRRIAAALSAGLAGCLALGAFQLVQATPISIAPELATKNSDNKTIVVHVTDESKKPIAETKVKSNYYSAQTNDSVDVEPKKIRDGVYEVSIPTDAKAFVLSASGKGHLPMKAVWQANEIPDGLPKEFSFELPLGTTIGGRIDDDEGNPISGAQVFLLVPTYQGQRPHLNFYEYSVTTEMDGTWSSDKMPADLDEVWVRLHHPDYISDNTYGGTVIEPSINKLRERSHRAIMSKGVTISGVVKDDSGNPIENATVCQGHDRFGSEYPSTKTNAKGEFQYENCKTEEMILTTIATGFAPALQELQVKDDNQPIVFELSKGNQLKIRVEDSDGNPLSGVYICPDTWRGHRSLTALGRFKTDSDGNYIWKDAPNEPVQFDVLKTGFMTVRNKILPVQADAHTIVLNQPMNISGTVTDAKTGKPITNFKTVEGIRHKNNPKFSWQNKSAKKGTNGKFDVTFTYPYYRRALKIEAIGYKAEQSRELESNKGSVTIDFKLTPVNPIAGTVLTPEGKPAADVKIVVATPNQWNEVAEGRFQSDDNRIAFSDKLGEFALSDDSEEFKLLFLHDTGVAIVAEEDFTSGQKVQLANWAKITGKVLIAGKPAKKVQVNLGDASGLDPKDPGFRQSGEVTSDDEGNFKFGRVLPNRLVGVSRIFESGSKDSKTRSTTNIVGIQTQPGKTHDVIVGGHGHTVIGRIAAPKDTPKFNWGICRIHPVNPGPKIPAGSQDWPQEKKEQWYKDWTESEAGAAFNLRSMELYASPINVEDNNSFRVDGLPPGDYWIRLSITSRSDAAGIAPHTQLGSIGQRFSIKEQKDKENIKPLDLGTLTLQIQNRLKKGDEAPPIKFTSLDGNPMSLEDFRGKVVLLDFWATWCGPCITQMPDLDALHKKYNDKNFVIIGVSIDKTAEEVKEFLKDDPHSWVQTHLPPDEADLVSKAYGVLGVPSLHLIGVDGKIVRSNLPIEKIGDLVDELLSEGK